MAARKPVWLDCDPGHDDALAIILAGYSPKLELLGLSTVAGNQSIEKVTDNALRVLAAAGLGHIPVFAGLAKPLMRPPLHCPSIHGESGLDGPLGGPILPPATATARPGKAVLAMFDAISTHYASTGERVTLIATGALSNIAALLILFPEVQEMIEIVLMGGALGLGNTGPVVEFNIQTDPEAAHVVFSAGTALPVVMIPLEVTHTALATPKVLERLLTPPDHPFLVLIADLILFFADTYKKVFKFDFPPLHDPCAVAYVLAPELFEVKTLRVDVEKCSALTAGQTVVDVWGQSGLQPNVIVCMEMAVEGFWDLLIEAVHAAAAASPLLSPPPVLVSVDREHSLE